MTSMCAGSWDLDVSPITPAIFGEDLNDSGESKDPRKTVMLKSGEGQRGWEALGLCRIGVTWH